MSVLTTGTRFQSLGRGDSQTEIPLQMPNPSEVVCPSKIDCLLANTLDSITNEDKEYWTFRGKASREHAHSFFQYPAMMVPQMQSRLIRAVAQVDKNVHSVFDPFVGSGTILGESIMQGLSFTGQDINPMAILLCLTKANLFDSATLSYKVRELTERVKSDTSNIPAVSFPGLTKWFRNDVIIALSRVKRAVSAEQEVWCRRFYWVAFAETIRLTSNSRNSTFKLHIRDKADITKRVIDPVKLFFAILQKNADNFQTHRNALDGAKLLNAQGQYSHEIAIHHIDSSAEFVALDGANKIDLLVTSPPYGDNSTTVPYGQHSYLPLQWITLTDIAETVGTDWLDTQQVIDRRSLGGIHPPGILKQINYLSEISDSFSRTLYNLKDQQPDRAARVGSFCKDLEKCIQPTLARLRPNAYMVWTVGNRCVGGQKIPLDNILAEFLTYRGAVEVKRIPRTIPQKR